MKMKHVNTLIFDYDGTLHNSMKIYKKAFLDVYEELVNTGYKAPKNFKDEEIALFLGQTPKAMWDDFGYDLPETVKQKASKKIGKLMSKMIDENQAELYDGTIETLKTLKDKGYTLVFLSNCTNNYMEKHRKVFKLDQYFDDMINAEMYDYIPKKTILNKIKHRYNNDLVVIGDRHYDIDAGVENDLTTIGCNYGYGSKDELKNATLTINAIDELLNIF